MNSRTRTIIFNLAALAVLAGASLHLIRWMLAPYLFAVGAASIAVCYLTLPTKELGFRERRLHRYNIFSALLMILASSLMFSDRKEWVLCLTIAAILQLYTAFVTPKK